MENKQEIWKDVKGYERIYQVSNLGNIRSLDRIVSRGNDKYYNRFGRILRPSLDGGGYKIIILYNSKTKKTAKIHRLVAETFHENKNNLYCVNHIDGNKLNNNVSNLEWCTSSDNQKHAYKLGLRKFTDEQRKLASFWGKQNNKLASNASKKKVIDSENGNTFNSLTEASMFCGIERSHLSHMLLGKIKNKTNLKYV